MNVAGVSLRSSCPLRAAAAPTVLVFDTYDGGRAAMAECVCELGYRARALATLDAAHNARGSIDIAILDHDPRRGVMRSQRWRSFATRSAPFRRWSSHRRSSRPPCQRRSGSASRPVSTVSDWRCARCSTAPLDSRSRSARSGRPHCPPLLDQLRASLSSATACGSDAVIVIAIPSGSARITYSMPFTALMSLAASARVAS